MIHYFNTIYCVHIIGQELHQLLEVLAKATEMIGHRSTYSQKAEDMRNRKEEKETENSQMGE